MGKDRELQTIQRKVYMTFFEDGVWDIFLGLFILGWGLSILTNGSYLPGIVFVCLYFTIFGIKKWLTYPRIGYVRFDSTSQRKIKTGVVILLTMLLLLGVLTGVLFGIGTRPHWLVDYFPLIFNGMLAVVVCLAAYWAGVNHFYLYAILIFLGAPLHVWLGIPWEFGFIGAGGIITLIGLGFLIRFLRKYPRVSQEGQDANR
jgi:predicted membrane protein